MKNHATLHRISLYTISAVLSAFVCVGCTGWDILYAPLDDGNDDPNGAPAPAPPVDGFVEVRLVNVSEFAVDAQFYLTTDPQAVTADHLFAIANAYTDGIGFLSLGVLAAGESADVIIECNENVFVGTLGGEFRDPASGESVGQSPTPRFALLGPQFDCGDRITFRFFLDVDGQPSVTLSIQ